MLPPTLVENALFRRLWGACVSHGWCYIGLCACFVLSKKP
jgi:hypothetical protein